MMEGVLVLSTSRGRYALDFATGPQLTTGDRIAIRLAGNWIAGTVEHSRRLYAVEDGSAHDTAGYYFLAQDGSSCGLCAGMEVRIL